MSGPYNIDGFVYHMSRKRANDEKYVVCKRRRCSCKASGKILPDGKFVLLQKHNHATELYPEEIQSFKAELRQAVRSLHTSTNKKIYDEISVRYPNAAVYVSYYSIRCSMDYWRKSGQPKVLTLEESANISKK